MKDWIVKLLTSHGKAHNIVLMMTAVSFVRVCWYKPDPVVIAATGGVLATLYGANAWAGTKSTPPAAE